MNTNEIMSKFFNLISDYNLLMKIDVDIRNNFDDLISIKIYYSQDYYEESISKIKNYFENINNVKLTIESKKYITTFEMLVKK